MKNEEEEVACYRTLGDRFAQHMAAKVASTRSAILIFFGVMNSETTIAMMQLHNMLNLLLIIKQSGEQSRAKMIKVLGENCNLLENQVL